MCCELPFYLSDAECPPFSSLTCALIYAKANYGQHQVQEKEHFSPFSKGIEQFEGTLKRQKDWLYYMLMNTRGLTCTQLHTNLSVCVYGRGTHKMITWEIKLGALLSIKKKNPVSGRNYWVGKTSTDVHTVEMLGGLFVKLSPFNPRAHLETGPGLALSTAPPPFKEVCSRDHL